MITHAQMRALVVEAFPIALKRPASRPEAACVQAIAKIETGYSDWWKPPGNGSFNMGAIQKGASWKGETFSYVDTSPNADGTSTPYPAQFRKYPTALDGTVDLVLRVLTGGQPPGRSRAVAPFAAAGDLHGFSSGLFDTVYFQGYGRTREERIAHHELAVRNACAAAARDLGEPMPDGTPLPPGVRVLREGSTGVAVVIVQRIIGVAETGYFGPGTTAALRGWQKKNRLKVDGIWGPVAYHVVETELDGGSLDALQGFED